MGRLKLALKSAVLFLSCAAIVYVLLFRLDHLASLVAPRRPSADLASVSLESVAAGAPRVRLTELRANLNILILVSPGAHCAVCVEKASHLDDFIRSLSQEHNVASYIVADGTQTSVKALRIYGAAQVPNGTILFDRDGKLREVFRLPSGPELLALSKKGALEFLLPLDHDLWAAADSDAVLAALIEAKD